VREGSHNTPTEALGGYTVRAVEPVHEPQPPASPTVLAEPESPSGSAGMAPRYSPPDGSAAEHMEINQIVSRISFLNQNMGEPGSRLELKQNIVEFKTLRARLTEPSDIHLVNAKYFFAMGRPRKGEAYLSKSHYLAEASASQDMKARVYLETGNLYADLAGDQNQAAEYWDKSIAASPESIYAEAARKRLAP